MLPGLFLTIYRVRYPHAVPFLRNEITLFSTKNSKNACRLGGRCNVLNAQNLKELEVKIQLRRFTGLSCPFLAIPHACSYFPE